MRRWEAAEREGERESERERRGQCGLVRRTWCWRQERRRRRRRRLRRGREITGEQINKRREYGAGTRRGKGRGERETIARNEHTGHRGVVQGGVELQSESARGTPNDDVACTRGCEWSVRVSWVGLLGWSGKEARGMYMDVRWHAPDATAQLASLGAPAFPNDHG